ncbi:Uncharacterized protein APZ42_003159, partial [Daphnia magna]
VDTAEKTYILKTFSKILHDLKALELDVDKQSEMINVLSSVERGENTPAANPAKKRNMLSVFSNIVYDLTTLALDVNQKSEMINIFSSVAREENTLYP